MKDIMIKLKITCVPGMSIAHVKTVCWEREEVGRRVCTSTNKDRKTNTNDLISEEENHQDHEWMFIMCMLSASITVTSYRRPLLTVVVVMSSICDLRHEKVKVVESK